MIRVSKEDLLRAKRETDAVTINGEKKTDIDAKIDDTMFIENTYLILKRGKKNYYLCKK